MRILKCHNYYQIPGGEDRSYEVECRILESGGHHVISHTLHNDAIQTMSPWEVTLKTLWNRQSYNQLRKLIRSEHPDVMDCNNIFPLISPSAYYAAKDSGLPVVQSLHNFRLMCPNGLLLRENRICEDCLGKSIAWPGIMHGCYRGSRNASAVVAMMLGLHRLMRTWTEAIDGFIVLSDFCRHKFIGSGLPPEKIFIKPNTIYPDPGPGMGRGGYAVFAGRLSPEKGISILLEAWSQLTPQFPLKIIGEGPLGDAVRKAAAQGYEIEMLGYRKPEEVLQILGDAAFLIVPSICYETFGRVIVEAFAKGTPVIVSGHGSMTELVEDHKTGLCFTPGDADDLALKVREMADNPSTLSQMRLAARQEYEMKFTSQVNCLQMIEIFERVIGGTRFPEAEAPRAAPAPLDSESTPPRNRLHDKAHSSKTAGQAPAAR